MKKAIFAALVIAMTSHLALADTAVDAYPDVAAIPAPLAEYLRNGRMFEEQYIAMVLGMVRNANATHMYIDQTDIDSAKQRRDKEIRCLAISSLMRYDANLDSVVSTAEITEEMKNRRGGEPLQDDYVAREVASIMSRYDADKDGNITLKEMASPKMEETSFGGRDTERLTQLLALDPDKDGKLTVAELSILAHKAFRTLDTDGDGMISSEESGKLGRKPPFVQLPATCAIPQPAKDDKIIFTGVYEGKTLTNLSVTGQEKITNVIPVEVAKETGNIYLVVASYTPAIWQLSGELSRITRLVVIGRNQPNTKKVSAGVIGLPASKITFIPGSPCLRGSYYSPEFSRDTETARNIITPLTGRAADVINGIYATGRVKISSAEAAFTDGADLPTPEGFDTEVWGYNAYNKSGFVNLKKDDVIADGEVEDYKVLPSYAGLAKLVHDGAIEHMKADQKTPPTDSASNTSGPKVPTDKNYYKIVREIPSYPAGLTGAHAVHFVIGKGIKPPEGSAGHSCVLIEETGQKTGPLCEESH